MLFSLSLHGHAPIFKHYLIVYVLIPGMSMDVYVLLYATGQSSFMFVAVVISSTEWVITIYITSGQVALAHRI